MKTITKRALALVMAMLMLCMVIPFSAAAATTVSVLDGQVTVTDSVGNGTLSAGTVTIQAKGGFLSQTTNNITITNESGSKAKLTFTWTASNYSSFTDPNGGSTASGTYSQMLDAGATVTMSIKGKKAISSNTASLKLSGFSLTAAAASSKLTVDYDSALGSVTADGVAIASGSSQDVNLGTAVALVATPASGATFLGWINTADNAILSTATSYSVELAQDMTVKPVFVGAGSAPYFGVGTATRQSFKGGLLNMQTFYYHTVAVNGYLFDDLNAAAAAAAASATHKYIVLMNDGTLPAGTWTVPAGVTLLVPFENTNKLYTTNPETTGLSGNTTVYKTPTAYRTLTMAQGANLVINGTMSLSGQHRACQGDKTSGGSPSGPTAFVDMAQGSNITVNNGGILYAWGYVIGDGTVTANSGSTVYELFQMEDFRGGSQITAMENGVFPMSQYYIQNIEVPLTLYSGAKEYAYTSAHMSNQTVNSSVGFIASSDSMFNLTSGYVTKAYDGATDRLSITANGTMTISPIRMSLGTSSLDSEEYILPINGNISIVMESGSLTLSQDIAMLPGTRIIVDEDATVALGNGVSVYVFDADQWGPYCSAHSSWIMPIVYAPSKTYTRTTADLVDAYIQIDGTIDASLGYLYTTEGGAAVVSSGTGVINMVANTEAMKDLYEYDMGTKTYTKIPIVPAVLTNGDGTQVSTITGTYEYTNDVWCNHVVVDLPAKDATCTDTGLTAGSSCACGQNGTAQEVIPALGHTWVDANCTTAKTCSVCGATEGEALGHTWVEADCDTAKTCSVCGATEGEALGHTWVEADCDTAKTCSVCGATEGEALGHTWVEADCDTAKTCSVCGATEGEALGHTWVEADCDTAKTCSVCGATEGEALGHTWVEADCDTAKTCSVCGATEGEALGHTWVEADCTAPKTCSVCGATEGEALAHEYFYPCDQYCMNCYELTNPDAAHNVAHVEAVEPTCQAMGNIEYWYCTDCGTAWADEGLTMQTNMMSVKLGTVEHEYFYPCDQYCMNCYELTNPDAAHNVAHVEAVEPTCQAMGNIEYWYCTDCGTAWADEGLTMQTNMMSVKLGMVEHEYFYPCDQYCMNCYELTNPDAAHNVAHVEAVEPTCQAMGNIEYWYCTDCGTAWTDEGLTMQTNMMSVKLGTVDHVYVDGACQWCGEADPDAPADEGTVVKTYTTNGITFTIYELEDASHKLVVSGTGAIPTWAGMADYAATIKTLVIEEGITSIGYGVFKGVMMEAVSLPTTLTVINGTAFQNCTNLKSIDLHEGITNIGFGAFQYAGLTEVTIPASVTTMGNGVFFKCTNLTTVTFCNGRTNFTIPKQSFSGCTALTTINWGTRVLAVGVYAFERCDSLTAVRVPGHVTTLLEGSFRYCSNLETIVLEEGVQRLGAHSFLNGTNVKNVSLPTSLVLFGSWSFANNFALEEITVPEGIAKIGDRAFSFCQALKKVNLPSTLTEIGARTFLQCRALNEIVLPASVTKLGALAFYNCKGLTSFVIPESMTTINSSAFSWCDLIDVVYVDSATIAAGLSSKTVYGELIKFADTIAIRADITSVPTYITTNYKTVGSETVDGVEYVTYSK